MVHMNVFIMKVILARITTYSVYLFENEQIEYTTDEH